MAHPLEQMVWKGNKFWNCEIYVFSLSGLGANSYIENNWFGGSDTARTTRLETTSRVEQQSHLGRAPAGRSTSASTRSRHGRGSSRRGLNGIRRPTPTMSSGTSSASANASRTSPTATTSTTTLAPAEARARLAASSFPYVNGSRDNSMNYHLAGPSLADGYVPAAAPYSDLTTDFDGQPRSAPGRRLRRALVGYLQVHPGRRGSTKVLNSRRRPGRARPLAAAHFGRAAKARQGSHRWYA